MSSSIPQARVLDNWLVAYHKLTAKTESPDMFHLWTGIWALAGALQRKVWFPYLTRHIYPNLYVVLVAPPGTARKGAALTIGKDLLRNTGVPLASSSITGPALVQMASESTQVYERPDPAHPNDESFNISETHNSLSLCSDEMATFFGKDNFQMLALLTDWFDCPAPWEHRTKTNGTDTVEAVWFNMLAATTPESLSAFLPQDAVGGGFTSRVIWVYEDQARPRIAFPSLDPELQAQLQSDLIYIQTHVRGPVQFSAEAHEFYTNWYENTNWDAGVEAPVIQYYLTRKPAHVIRVAMVCHFAYSDNMTLEVNDLKMAINLIEQLEPKMPDVFRSTGLNRYSDVQNRVFNYIMRQAPLAPYNVVRESQLLEIFAADLDLRALDLIMQSLIKQGKVKKLQANSIIGYQPTQLPEKE